jgi:hypothetical protein
VLRAPGVVPDLVTIGKWLMGGLVLCSDAYAKSGKACVPMLQIDPLYDSIMSCSVVPMAQNVACFADMLAKGVDECDAARKRVLSGIDSATSTSGDDTPLVVWGMGACVWCDVESRNMRPSSFRGRFLPLLRTDHREVEVTSCKPHAIGHLVQPLRRSTEVRQYFEGVLWTLLWAAQRTAGEGESGGGAEAQTRLGKRGAFMQ